MSEGDAVKIALFGAAGRMGQEILRCAPLNSHVRIIHAYDVACVGEIIHKHEIEAAPSELPDEVRAIVDFSSPLALTHNLSLALKKRIPYVSGVTGFTTDPQPAFERAAKEIPVIYAANIAPGMNVMFLLAAQAAKVLPEFKRYLTEIHHTAKKDIPSGTALKLADMIHSATQQPTEISSLRVGDVIGEHRLIFGGPGERLEIVHHADSRAVFAHGALKAAEWIVDKAPGYYSMGDVLGLST